LFNVTLPSRRVRLESARKDCIHGSIVRPASVQEDESERSWVKGALRRRCPWTFNSTDVDSDKIGI
jgi:hypothetical protein